MSDNKVAQFFNAWGEKLAQQPGDQNVASPSPAVQQPPAPARPAPVPKQETRSSAPKPTLAPAAISEFTGDYQFLSNFYYSPVRYEGVVYETVEHAYQAAKTNNLEDRKLVQCCRTPGEAKRMGQKVDLRVNWDSIKLDTMRELLASKFSSDTLKQMLTLTSPRDLIEGNNWNDTYWGVCAGKGENWLGKLLMELRDKL